MKIANEQIRAHRLRAHHLDEKLSSAALAEAAGACGLQNSPPGAWEAALFNRLEGCTLQGLHTALYEEKSLLQAWSFRGAPVVFPTGQSGVFLTPLMAQPGEEPWIYTLGITGALDFVGMAFDDLLARTKAAARWLDTHTVKSKEALDAALAARIRQKLPPEKQALWDAPSLYGRPGRQTMGGAAVSFLLRPCSFSSLVVFGERQGVSPTFTSFQNWVGRAPTPWPKADRALARKFLHCYGPATPQGLAAWLGCSRRQARRIWNAAAEEMEPVEISGKKAWILSQDREALLSAPSLEERLLLLGAHDPYLDVREKEDRALLLPDTALQRAVWKTVANPGAIVKGGRVAGIWRQKTQKECVELSFTLFEALSAAGQQALKAGAEEYAAFRGMRLSKCAMEE